MIPGDVNGDNKVNGSDSLLINQVVIGLRQPTDSIFGGNFQNGDVNGDNQVNGADSLLINQVLIGLRSHIVTKVIPNEIYQDQFQNLTIYGKGFKTNPQNVELNSVNCPNATRISDYEIKADFPRGIPITGKFSLIVNYNPQHGTLSFAKVTVLPIRSPSSLVAQSINSSLINLNWFDNTTEDGFVLERSNSNFGPWNDSFNLSSGINNYNDINLTPDTNYCYRIKAFVN